MVQKKFRAVLLWRYREVVRFLNDFAASSHQFQSRPARERLLAHCPVTINADSWPSGFSASQSSGDTALLGHDALHDASAVAKLRKQKLAARSHVIEPAFDCYFLPHVF